MSNSQDQLPASNEAAALAAIVAWSAECPHWQRDALRRLCAKDRLDDDDLAALIPICRGDASSSSFLSSTHVRDHAASLAVVTLQSVHSVQHVNALAAGEKLSFDKIGVTIIYGDNGSGKSGYARVLKKVCRARTKGDPILPNVYAANSGPPAATIEFAVGAQHRSTAWAGTQAADPMLSAVSVFDSRTANAHVDETNDVAYTPVPLRMLASLARACQELKQRLNAEIKALERQKPEVLGKPACRPTTPVGKLIAGLTGSMRPESVASLATLSAADKARLDSLKSDLAGDPVRAARQLRALKAQLDAMLRRLEELQALCTNAQAAALKSAYDAYLAARAAATVASADLFGADPLPDIGSDTWKALWEAARAYSLTTYAEQPFPATGSGDRCVLCQQELSPEAADRLRRFESFIQDESKRREQEAQAAYALRLSTLQGAQIAPSELLRHVALLRESLADASHAKHLRAGAIRLMWRTRAILRGHAAATTPSLPPAPALSLGPLQDAALDLEARAQALLDDSGSPARKALVAECDALADREWLAVVQADVIAHIDRLKTIDALTKAAKDTATNRITTKSNELAQTLVTNMLRSQFAIEVNRLGVANLAIELRQDKTTQGVPLFRISLINKPSQKVGDVLSEGEHRCVALAAFLAELSTIDAHSAIVFDDPVSSLDHMHREKVAERLADEGLKRQVIVFTHDIAFLFQLHEACREAQTHTAFRAVNRGKDAVGFCQPNPPPKAQPVDKVIEAMRTQLTNRTIHFDRGNHEEWTLTVRSLQEQLRTTWERAVEDILSPVIKRLANKVDTKGLPLLTVLEMKDCEVMREAFGRCSSLLHSEAEALNSPLPEPARIEAEIDALEKWIADIRNRQTKIKPSS